MKEILQWWINQQPLSEYEENLLFSIRPTEMITTDNHNFVIQNLFDRMPNCNISIDTHTITVDTCATNFINELFNRYVTNDTLVITTSNEHDNVKKCLSNCENVLELDYYEDILKLKISKIINEGKKYKNVFVYIIGTQISSGEITPQIFFEELKKSLNNLGIKHTIVIDDVHGMFLLPRDYRTFDYIISTAHALVRDFDMGILISKNGDIGFKATNWCEEYLYCLNVIIERTNKMLLFSNVMEEYFCKWLSKEEFSSLTKTSPHIFSIKTTGIQFTQKMWEMLDKYEIRIELGNDDIKYIRFRAQQFIKQPRYLIKGIEKLEMLLEILTNK